jgi:hypothetical protein
MTTKPIWAQEFEHHVRMERAAQAGRRQALTKRCPENVSTGDTFGPRCTADADTEHAHRWWASELPEQEAPS